LNAACTTGSYDRKLATLARVALLIIDDFGLKPLRAFETPLGTASDGRNMPTLAGRITPTRDSPCGGASASA
jgi:hypothetical protein